MTDERLNIWLGFAKFFLGTLALGLVGTFINNAIQEREVELKEMEQVGRFLEYALSEDPSARKRFAEYFARVTRSDALRERWTEYLNEINSELKAEKEELETAVEKKDIDPKEREDIKFRIRELEKVLSPVPSRSIDPEVYFYIREESQQTAAKTVAKFLSERSFSVQGIEQQSSGPTITEIRFFRREEKGEAEVIGEIIRKLGVQVNVAYVAGYEQNRQRRYELWFSSKPITVTPN